MHFLSSLATLLIADKAGIARVKEESQVGRMLACLLFQRDLVLNLFHLYFDLLAQGQLHLRSYS